LTVSLNLLKEKDGKDIKLFVPLHQARREGNSLVFFFQYLPQIDGIPIMRWIGIRTRGDEKKSLRSHDISDDDGFAKGFDLIVYLKTDSKVEVLDDDGWRELYSGPKNIEIDLSGIKANRERLGFTQMQVAEALCVNLRTYQKWENGEVEGIKGISLVKLITFLDFDFYDVVKGFRLRQEF